MIVFAEYDFPHAKNAYTTKYFVIIKILNSHSWMKMNNSVARNRDNLKTTKKNVYHLQVPFLADMKKCKIVQRQKQFVCMSYMKDRQPNL